MSSENQDVKTNADGTKEFNLSDGRTVVLGKAKGLHARKAIKYMDGDESLYMNAIMHQIVTVDGKTLPMEDFDEMEMSDYTKIMGELGASFTSKLKT